MILVANNIKKTYGNLDVLKGIDLNLASGGFYVIVGASGAGKTTLLQILGTLDKPTQGTVLIKDQRVDNLSSRAMAKFRSLHIGFVFQFHNLLPDFTALENICIPGFIAKREEKEVKNEALKLMDLLDISHRIHHKPSALSGGEQQRVAVARALINQPSIVFADEPSGNLDSVNANKLHQLFKDLNQEFKTTFIIATHNEELTSISNQIIKVKDGFITTD